MQEGRQPFWARPSTFFLVLIYMMAFGLYGAYKLRFPIIWPDILPFLVGFLSIPIAGGIAGTLASIVADLIARKPVRPLAGFSTVTAILVTVLLAGEILDFFLNR